MKSQTKLKLILASFLLFFIITTASAKNFLKGCTEGGNDILIIFTISSFALFYSHF